MIDPTPSDCAYAAGFFDGEGSVMIMPGLNTEKWKTHARLMATASQVDPRPLMWLKERWGGNVHFKTLRLHPRNRPVYQWDLCGLAAVKFLEAVRPFLQVKGSQADVAFAFRKTVQKKGGIRVPVADEVRVRREELRQQMKVLNKRGVA